MINRNKASLDIFRLRDESLEESDNLPDPKFLARKSRGITSDSLPDADVLAKKSP